MTCGVRPCTDPKGDAKKAKADEAGAVVPEATVNRRQKKKEKTFEYEVKWQFKPIEANVWVEKDVQIKIGYKKLVKREDERQAAMAGLQTKLLTQPGVEKHLGDFGVDLESASHTQINQLSGGMKVKEAEAAAVEGEVVDFLEVDADRKDEATLRDVVAEEVLVPARGAPPTGWRVDRFPEGPGRMRLVSTPPWSLRTPTCELELWLIIGKAAQREMRAK